MFSAVITFVRGIGLVIVAVAACWFIYDYVGSVRSIGEYKGIVASWESKYSAAVDAQKKSEETITQLREERTALMTDLVEWKRQYAAIDKKSKVTRQQVRNLEAKNDEIRNILRTRVPNDVWRLLFPRPASTNTGDDPGRKAGAPAGVPSAL